MTTSIIKKKNYKPLKWHDVISVKYIYIYIYIYSGPFEGEIRRTMK